MESRLHQFVEEEKSDLRMALFEYCEFRIIRLLSRV